MCVVSLRGVRCEVSEVTTQGNIQINGRRLEVALVVMSLLCCSLE